MHILALSGVPPCQASGNLPAISELKEEPPKKCQTAQEHEGMNPLERNLRTSRKTHSPHARVLDGPQNFAPVEELVALGTSPCWVPKSWNNKHASIWKIRSLACIAVSACSHSAHTDF